MEKLKYVTVFFFAIMLVSVLGCTSTSNQDGTGEFKRAPMTKKSKKSFLADVQTLRKQGRQHAEEDVVTAGYDVLSLRPGSSLAYNEEV